jgi:hypothetical protein
MKVSHRAWFSPDDYRALYTETQRCAKTSPHPRYAWEYKQLHDLVLFLANTGLRSDEAARLEYRDVSVVDDDRSGETIFVIECRGKRGYGPCKSTANAVPIFRRLQKRNQPLPTDRIFPRLPTRLFNNVLGQAHSQVRSRGKVANALQPAPHLHFLPAARGCQRAAVGLELPHQRGHDREILRGLHQDAAGCVGDQRAQRGLE